MPRSAASFDRVARLYDRARPRYPRELVDDLVRAVGIGPAATAGPNHRVLEIGCGTGQITVPLAARGLGITALEPGPALAAIARDRLTMYPGVEVVERRFEDYELPSRPFDLVVCATAFHWVDPRVRVVKAARVLRPGGHLAVVDTHWGVGRRRAAFALRSQACYRRWSPEASAEYVPPTIGDLPVTRPELQGAPGFVAVERRLYEQTNRYSTAAYLDLLGTFSDVNALEPPNREGFLECIGRLIDGEFGGELVRTDLRELWLATRRPGPTSG